MHGIDDLYIGMRLDDVPHGTQNIVHRLTVVFTAVAGQYDHALILKIERIQLLRGETEGLPHGGLHRVNDSVACDENFAAYCLPAQIFRVGGGRRKVQGGNVAHEGAVHLLGEGRVFVIGAQSRLNVPDGNFVVKCRKCAREGR